MSRQKKEQKALNCRLDAAIWNELNDYCEENGTNKTFVVEKALKQYLSNYKKQQSILKQFVK